MVVDGMLPSEPMMMMMILLLLLHDVYAQALHGRRGDGDGDRAVMGR